MHLIRRLLKHMGCPPKFTSTGCEIICFPRPAYSHMHTPIEDLPFWPRFGFSQILVFAVVYGLLISCHSYFM